MDTKIQHGYLVLADISGYTSFVAATELEHAHDILTELLELVLGQLTPTLTLSKLEGDAVFVYAPEARLPRGETVLELVEATYVAFRDRQEAIRRRTTCQCNACRSIPALDLKFIVHHGDFIAQRVAGIHELVGSDVNLIHRLSKNHVAEATGWRAYAMFTKAGLAHMGLRPEGMHEQTEAYEHLGQVQTYSLDLRARYAALVDARRVVVAPEDAHNVLTTDVPAPMAEVWSLLNEPRNREEWEGIHIVPVSKVGGRTGAGARSHCMHGDNVSMVETVLDWRPFDYFTVEQNSRGIPGMIINITYKLTQTPTGTRTERRERWMGSGFGPLYKFLCYWMDVIFGIKKGFEQRLKQLAAQADKPETGG